MTKRLQSPDLAIIGAGPAGIGAALAAREAGLSVTVIDDQLEPGGQIWRSAGSTSQEHARLMGAEYELGRKRVNDFLSAGTDYRSSTSVWQIEYEGAQPVVYCSGPEGGGTVRPKNLIIATGAVERPLAVPGWTLPGVMTGGGFQILLKSAELCPVDAVLAGGGPLLWLLAAQMVKAGSAPKAVIECVTVADHLAATRWLPGVLRAPAPLLKGLKLIADVQRAGVPVHRFARDLRIEGDMHVSGVSFQNSWGKRRRIEANMVGLHCGVVPNQQLSRLLRVDHRWDDAQYAFQPKRAHDLRVADRIFIGGDGARIGGADVAWLEGQLIGKTLAGKSTNDIRHSLRKAEAARPFIDRLYRPPMHLRRPSDETVICRCEAVRAGRIRQAVRDGAVGPNQVKFMLRPGMGPCQGRVCGLAVTEIISEVSGRSMGETGYFRIRPPIKPVPLGVIASDPGARVDAEDNADDHLASKNQLEEDHQE